MSVWLSSKKRRRCMKKKLTGLPDTLDIVQPEIAEIYETSMCSTSAPETWETDVTYTSSDKELVHLNNNKKALLPQSDEPIPQISKTSPIHLKSLNVRGRQKGRLPQDAGMPGTERKKALRNKFKRLIRKWNCVRILLKLSKVSTQKKEMNQTFRVVDNMGSVFTFDPGYSKKVITTYGKLSDRVRIIFMKDPKERTKADERILLEVINRLPLFSNFPSRVKQDLAQVMVFDTFEKGRIVIRQGDPGTRVYFLLSGQVFLIQTETDPKSGAKRTIHLKTLTGGSIFGEMALIRSIRRDHTAVTSDDSEFLSLGKDDFEKVLKKRLLKDNTERYDFLRSSQHLKAFSDKQIQKCADSSELKTYCDNKVILGDVETTENVYFIKKGRCKIVKRVYFVRHQSPYTRPVLFLHETPEQREKFLNKNYGRKMRWRRQEVHLLTITTLYPGDYFGAGENLQDMYVVARGKTECLLLNAVQFQIHSKMDVLRRLKTEREDVLPSDIELYKRFETNRKWLEYRQQLVKEVSGRKPGRHESEIYIPLTDL